jgi:hypothetical protein
MLDLTLHGFTLIFSPVDSSAMAYRWQLASYDTTLPRQFSKSVRETKPDNNTDCPTGKIPTPAVPAAPAEKTPAVGEEAAARNADEPRGGGVLSRDTCCLSDLEGAS